MKCEICKRVGSLGFEIVPYLDELSWKEELYDGPRHLKTIKYPATHAWICNPDNRGADCLRIWHQRKFAPTRPDNDLLQHGG